MNKAPAVLALVLATLSAHTFAQDVDADAARQRRMDAAYADAHHESRARADARAAGHSFHNGVRETGHAIHRGVRATGHAIHDGVRRTGHAIHRGADKVTGR